MAISLLNTLKVNGLAKLVLVLFLVFFGLSFQGFDVCDEGWYLTFYQQIFENPETVEYNFAFWLTGVVGGVWYQLFPFGGILIFRLLAIIVNIATLVLVYRLLKDYVKKELLLIGLGLIFFINNFGFLVFYYNHLSALLAVISICFLIRGLSRDKKLFILIAGCLTALNIFSRLPNLILLGFVLVIPFQKILNPKIRFKKLLKQVLYYTLGVFLGLIIVYGIMNVLGHIEIFKQSVLGIIDKGQESNSNHNFSRLLSVYMQEYKTVLFAIVKVGFILSLFSIVKSWFNSQKWITTVLAILAFGYFSYLFLFQSISVVYAISICGLLIAIFDKRSNSNMRLISFSGILLLVLLPIGSDGGIHNVGYMAVWFGFPVFLYSMNKIQNISFNRIFSNQNFKLDISRKDLWYFTIVLMISFFVVKLYRLSTNSYFDKGNRLEKTDKINSPLAQYTFTTEKRALIINDALEALNNYVDKGDYLLAYDNIPMLNFLTQTKPYMGNSWVWVYDGVTFENKLKEAEANIKILPVIITQKFYTIGEFSEPIDDYFSETKEESYLYNSKRVKAMNDFLLRNQYEIVWENSFFNILKPVTNKNPL